MNALARLFGGPRIRAQIETLMSGIDLQGPMGRAALQVLRSQPQQALEELLALIEHAHRDELDRIAQVTAALYTESLAPLYLKALADPRVPVAMTTSRALAGQRLPDPDAALRLLERPSTVRAAVFTALAGQRDHLNLAELLRVAGRLSGADRAAVFELVGAVADRDAVPALVARLDAREADYRLGIVRLLGGVQAPEVTVALSRMLRDPDWRVRLAAMDGLVRDLAAVDPALLVNGLADRQFEVQSRAIDLLCASPQKDIAALLAPLLGHEWAPVRRAAVEVLNHVATPDNLRALLGAVKDRDWWVRSRSADVLGRIGGPRVMNAVMELLRDPDSFVRRTAVEIINAAGGGKACFDALASALRDSDWWVRERAIDGLAASGDPRALELLRPMLAQNGDEQTLVVLIGALARLQSAEVISGSRARRPAAGSAPARHLVSLAPSHRGGQPGAGAHARRPGPARGGRGHAVPPGDLQPDPQQQDFPDSGGDAQPSRSRHAAARPGAAAGGGVGPDRPQPGLLPGQRQAAVPAPCHRS